MSQQTDQSAVRKDDGSTVRPALAPSHIEARLVAATEARLGVAVRLVRWDVHARTGASIPVFAIPAAVVASARALGLTVEAA